jgi:hypothetical protein
LLRCLYREIAIRFKPKVGEERKRAYLADFGLEIVREDPFAPDQVVPRDAADRKWGDDLILVANALAGHERDIMFARPISSPNTNGPRVGPSR